MNFCIVAILYLVTIFCYARVGESQIVYQITQSEYDTLTDVSYDALRHQKIFTADFDTLMPIRKTPRSGQNSAVKKDLTSRF